MTAPNPYANATNAAYRVAARWVKENHPDVWAEIHQTERARHGLARRPVNPNQHTTTTGRSQ